MNYRLICSYTFVTLALTLLASAQGTKSPGRTPSPTTTNTTSSPTQPSMTPPDLNMGRRAFIRGNVVVDDGTQITESATIQTVCQGRRQTVTHTDSHGGFSFVFCGKGSAALGWVCGDDTHSTWS